VGVTLPHVVFTTSVETMPDLIISNYSSLYIYTCRMRPLGIWSSWAWAHCNERISKDSKLVLPFWSHLPLLYSLESPCQMRCCFLNSIQLGP